MGLIAVIGAGGFVGSRLIESFILDGFKEFLSVVRSYRNLAQLSRFGSTAHIRIADAENEAELIPVLKDCSIVVNLISGEAAGIVKSTKTIYKSCVAAGVKRLIHLSSAVVYGQVESPGIHDDSPPIKDHWMPYARAKAESELFLRENSGTSQIEITVLRPGIVWGPRSRWSLNAALDLVNSRAYLIGGGLGICNTIYIDNLVSCIITCCGHPSDASGFFNISDEELVTWYDFYGSLAAYLNYDMSRIPKVPGDCFTPSLNARIQDFMSSRFYLKLREHFKPDTRSLIKHWMRRGLGNKYDELMNVNKDSKLQVTRDMWGLQNTKYKLSSVKFSRQFDYLPPVSFRNGVQMTIDWLKFLGM